MFKYSLVYNNFLPYIKLRLPKKAAFFLKCIPLEKNRALTLKELSYFLPFLLFLANALRSLNDILIIKLTGNLIFIFFYNYFLTLNI